MDNIKNRYTKAILAIVKIKQLDYEKKQLFDEVQHSLFISEVENGDYDRKLMQEAIRELKEFGCKVRSAKNVESEVVYKDITFKLHNPDRYYAIAKTMFSWIKYNV